MCGLVGMAGDLSYSYEKIMKRLLMFDYFRGPDSTGFAAVRSNGDVKIAKMASHPLDLFDSKKFGEALNAFQSKVFIGHNRAATVGKVSTINAHPFRCEHIVGAHNGTLDKESWDRLQEAAGVETDVDSEAIFACIAKNGIEETVKLMEEGRTYARGAWALVWFNLEDNTLNFLRNKHRPLWFCFDEDLKRMLWGSEWQIIRAALIKEGKAEIDLATDKQGFSFWSFEADYWYSIDIDSLYKGFEKLPKFRIKKLKGREPAPVASTATPPFTMGYPHGGQQNNIIPLQGTNHGKTTNSHGVLGLHNKSNNYDFDKENSDGILNIQNKPHMIEVIGGVTKPFGDFLEFNDVVDLKSHGCSWCKQDFDITRPGVVLYQNQYALLCPECSGEKDNRVYAEYSAFADFERKIAS